MKKLLFSAILAFALIAAQVGIVFAQDTTTSITGTVTKVEIKTDATTGAVTEVVVTYTDSTGATQMVSLTLADATAQGLVSTDTDGVTTETTAAVGSTVTIPEPTTTEEAQHPVGSALADFFGDLLGVDVAYDTIMSYRNGEAGNAGFGVLAQALWMTAQLQNNNPEVDGNDLFQQIVEAKLNKEYNIVLTDGTTIEADNWGQFKKAILKGEANNSVGDVMSGKQDPDEGETLTDQNENGNQNGISGNNNGNENKNKNKDKDKGHKGKGNK